MFLMFRYLCHCRIFTAEHCVNEWEQDGDEEEEMKSDEQGERKGLTLSSEVGGDTGLRPQPVRPRALILPGWREERNRREGLGGS